MCIAPEPVRSIAGRALHHGGGFSMLSKDTHWLMAMMFARRGYVVFNVNYRLAPQWPYPPPSKMAVLLSLG